MRSWAKELAGSVLVLILALGVGGFVLILRAQQGGLAASMAAAHIRTVSPPDGATDVPLAGEIQADYISRPAQDPAIKVEPPVDVTLTNGHWEGTTYVIDYEGLHENSLYHVELDQDDWTGKGEHKQIKVRWSFRTGMPTTVKSTPTPMPTSSASVPVTATPSAPLPDLIWYSGFTPAGINGLNGVDWNGNRRKTPRYVGNVQSPDGLRIYNSGTPSTDVFDADGNRAGVIAGLSPNMWADDSQQFCGITYRSPAGTQDLVTMPLDGSVHRVATISLPSAPTKSPQELGLVACSDLAHRAIVVGGDGTHIWSMAVISLTDGGMIYQTTYPNPITRMVASHDGHIVAEQVAGPANGPARWLIREVPGGSIVGNLTGVLVEGFSWDGTLIGAAIQGNSGLTGAEVMRWQTQTVVWSLCGCPSPFEVHVLAQPSGSKIAIAASDQHGIGSLTIVDRDGTTTSLPVGSQPYTPLF